MSILKHLWMTVIIFIALCMCAQAASVSIAWDPPIASDNVAGYRIYVGSASRDYDISLTVDVGMDLTGVVEIDLDREYYFAITAYSTNWNGHLFMAESGYSDELFLPLLPVLNPPRNPVFVKIDMLITKLQRERTREASASYALWKWRKRWRQRNKLMVLDGQISILEILKQV